MRQQGLQEVRVILRRMWNRDATAKCPMDCANVCHRLIGGEIILAILEHFRVDLHTRNETEYF